MKLEFLGFFMVSSTFFVMLLQRVLNRFITGYSNNRSIEEGAEYQMWREKLVAYGEQYAHPAWGKSHYKRVYDLCLTLAKDENLAIDEDVLLAAAYTHDIGVFEPYKAEGAEHSVASLKHYGDILYELGFPKEKIGIVGEVIKGHMFYSKPGHTPECRIFHDADTLDFMGIIGITRLLVIVGNDDWTPTLISAIELIKQFQIDLPRSLIYNASKKLGEIRKNEMAHYLEQLSVATQGFENL